jgi:hypothetical protein
LLTEPVTALVSAATAASTAPAAVALLRDPATIRARCHRILQAVAAGHSSHFTLQRDGLDAVAAQVEQITRHNYPDLVIPYHSRWRHFEVGGIDRRALLEQRLAALDSAERARARIDLTLISVLLDAGAGPQWHYSEPATGLRLSRSEGLGVASLHGFMQGCFSADPAAPLRVDASALLQMDAAQLATIFQVSAGNPLVGLAGRVSVLQRLGAALQAQPAVFGQPARPGGLFDYLTAGECGTSLPAARVLQALLDYLSGVWLTTSALDGVPLGDCWQHPLAGGNGSSAGWVPFHKLSQWLTYSLLEPFAWAGVTLTDLDDLTGLPEYRNGGLLLDAGVIVPTAPDFYQRRYRAADPEIIEWRALTVALLDELAPLVRARLGQTAVTLPLACILEGGTWAAGRAIARRLRDGGAPPLNIDSDGTVF